MPDPDETQRLNEQLREVQEHLTTLDNTQKVTKRIHLWIAALIFFALLLFGSTLYKQLKAFTTKNVVPIVAERAVAFLPQLVHSVARVGDHVMPIYLKEFEKQAPRYMPIITQIADKEFSAFFVRIEADTHKHFLELIDRITKKEQARLIQDVPALSDFEHQDILKDNLYAVLHDSLLMVLEEKFQDHLKPVHALQQTMEQYRSEIAGQDESDVEMKLLATGLELAGKRLAEEIE